MSETHETERKGQPASVSGFPVPQGFQAIRDEIDRMFHAFSLPEMSWRSGLATPPGAIGLRVDVAETGDGIEVVTELPGVAEEDVNVSLEDDVLRIRAEKRSESTGEDKKWHVVERSFGTFERAIRMPAGIDPAKVAARFADGVLAVTLPKPPEVPAAERKIAISKG